MTAVLWIGSADAVWSARVVATGLMLALPLLAISRTYRWAVLRPTVPWSLPRPFWAFAVPTGLAGIVGAMVGNRMEIIILNWFADPYAMGLFGLAFGLAGHVYAPAQAFIGPLVPAVSGLSEVDVASVRRAFLRTTRAGCAVGGVLVATAVPALAVLVPVIYGPRFAPVSDMLIVLGMSSALVLAGSPHMAFLMARLGGRRLLHINLVSFGANVILAFALIPIWGAWGAVLACATGMVVRTVQVTAGESGAWNIGAAPLSRSLGPMIWAIAIAASLWLVVRSSPLSPVVLAPAVAVAGGLLFVGAIRFGNTGLTTADAEAIAGSVPPKVRPLTTLPLRLLTGRSD